MRRLVVKMLDRRGLTTNEVARSISCDRTYLGSIRKGKVPITLAILEKLVLMLNIDRKRAAFAIEVMGSPDLYFDEAFENACYMVEVVLRSTVELTDGRPCGAVLASLSKEACENLAQQSSAQIAQKFAAVESLLDARGAVAA